MGRDDEPDAATRWYDGLALLRLRLLPSAVNDVLAGAALGAGLAAAPLLDVLRTCLTSACLYSAGMVFNDVADVAEDRRLGRDRPLVRGRIGRGSASLLGALLVAVALLAAPYARLGLLPLALALAVLLYDFVAKRWLVTGALVLGLCRLGNLALGYQLAAPESVSTGAAIAGLAYAGYVALAVWHGSLEDRPTGERHSRGVLLAAGLIGLLTAPWARQPLWLALGLTPTLVAVLGAGRRPSSLPARTGILLRGLSRFTCALALGAGAWLEAGLTAGLAYLVPPLLRRGRWT